MPTQPPATPPEPLLVASASSPVLHMPKPKHAVPPTRAVLNFENDKTEIEPVQLVEDTDEEEKVSPMTLSQEDEMSRVRFAHPPAPRRHPNQQQRRSIGTTGSEDSNRVYESALESPLEDLQDEISLATPNPQPIPPQVQLPPQQQLEQPMALPPPIQHPVPQPAPSQPAPQPAPQPAVQSTATGKNRRTQAGKMMEDLQLKSERLEEFTNVKELQRQVQMIQQQRDHERAEWHMREQAHRIREKEMMEKISETQAQLFHALAQAQTGLAKQHQQHQEQEHQEVYPASSGSYRHDSGYLEDNEIEPEEYTRRSASRGSSSTSQSRRPRPRPSRSMEYAHAYRPAPAEYYEDSQPWSHTRSRHYMPPEEEYAPVRPRSSSSSARRYAMPHEEPDIDETEADEDAYYYYHDKRRSRSSNSSRRAPTLEAEDDGEEDLTEEEDYEDHYMPPMAYHPRRPRSNSASARRYEEDPYYMAPPPPEEYYGRRNRRLVPSDSISRRRAPGERQHHQAMAMAAARRGMPPYMVYPPNYYPYS